MTLWLHLGAHGFKPETKLDISSLPCPSVAATGLGSYRYWLENDGIERERELTDKPPYRVSSMAEIRALPWNCYKVISTFSGCGGSCTGYRMAGFKVIWANEFVPAAQDSYRANMEPDCFLDCRDVKAVTADDILKITHLKVGELDLFDGSPPCQAFSTAGKRAKGWGKEKKYEHGAKQKNETLFDEYIRLLRGLQPKTFVAENVSGLVKGVAKGFFIDILKALKDCGYNVKAKLLDAQWLGVPQMRQRIIFIGVRSDLRLEPVHPKPLTYRYSVRDALPWIVNTLHWGQFENKSAEREVHSADNPASTVAATSGGQQHFTCEARVIHDTGGDSPNRWAANVDVTDKPCPAITVGVKSVNSNHFQVISDSNGQFGVKGDVLDRTCPSIRSQRPHDFIVKTQTERRKFTIAELKRICAFPDDFILTGSYAQQWERLGNSVPPVMMYHIARTIKTEILDKIK